MIPLLPIVLSVTLSLPVANEEKAAPAPGAKVATFSLKDIHRRPRALDDYKDRKAFVVAFLDTECPLSNLYVPTLIDLHKQYSDKGIQVLAIKCGGTRPREECSPA